MFIISGTKKLRSGIYVTSYWNGNGFGCKHYARSFGNFTEAESELHYLQEQIPDHMSMRTWAEIYRTEIIECPTEIS